MRITKTFCDICKKECDPERFGVVSGCVLKMNAEGKSGKMMFEGHYCEDDIGKILIYIENESRPDKRAESNFESNPRKE